MASTEDCQIKIKNWTNFEKLWRDLNIMANLILTTKSISEWPNSPDHWISRLCRILYEIKLYNSTDIGVHTRHYWGCIWRHDKEEGKKKGSIWKPVLYSSSVSCFKLMVHKKHELMRELIMTVAVVSRSNANVQIHKNEIKIHFFLTGLFTSWVLINTATKTVLECVRF